MKKFISLPIVMAFMLWAWGFFAPAQTQNPADEEKPTFYRLIPGVYVNGWPRFTVTYPKDWVEKRPNISNVFRVATPGPTPGARFAVWIGTLPLPLEKFADFLVKANRDLGATDVTVVSDKPSQLRDGTPAREVELQMVVNGLPNDLLGVATKKGDLHVHANVGSFIGKIGEDLRAIPYSLQYEPEKDQPVKVPPDIQEFLNKHSNDMVSHDLAKIMANYSDRYLNSGVRKGEVERIWRQFIGSWMSEKWTITDFVPAGDRAYLTGFVILNNLFTLPVTETSIIKEHGEWKWYGNQRDPAP
jgi:hypothetical protein